MLLSRIANEGNVLSALSNQNNVTPTGYQFSYLFRTYPSSTYNQMQTVYATGYTNNILFIQPGYRGITWSGYNTYTQTNYTPAIVGLDSNLNVVINKKLTYATSSVGALFDINFYNNNYYGISENSIIKFDNNFNVLWAKQVAVTNNTGHFALKIIDGYIYTFSFKPVSGSFTGNLCLSKLDTNGNLIFVKSLNFSPGSSAGYNSMQVDASNNIYCSFRESGGATCTVLKFDTSGNLLASTKINPLTGLKIVAFPIVVGSDGYVYLLTANTNSSTNYSNNYSVLKLSQTDLSISLQKTTVKPANLIDTIFTSNMNINPADGNLYLAGSLTNATYNASFAITAFSVTSGIATITYSTKATSPFTVGEYITLANFINSGATPNPSRINGNYKVLTSTTTQTTFAFTKSLSGTLIISSGYVISSTNSAMLCKINSSDLSLSWSNKVSPNGTYPTGGNPLYLYPSVVMLDDKINLIIPDGFATVRQDQPSSPWGYANSGLLIARLPTDGSKTNASDYAVAGDYKLGYTSNFGFTLTNGSHSSYTPSFTVTTETGTISTFNAGVFTTSDFNSYSNFKKYI